MKYYFLLVFVLGLGTMLRLTPALTRDFPINDGGMFYSMTKQLEKNHFALPKIADYNHLGIAYAYPPLGFITAGLLDKYDIWDRWDLYDIYRLLPPILASLTLIPFYYLARIILKSKNKALFATLTYAALPSAYYTFIAGGGLTRGLGMMMALYTLLLFLRKKYWGTAILLSATFASHLEMSLFAVTGIVLFALAYHASLKKLIFIGWRAGLLSSWWWGTILWQSGVEPFLSALATNKIIVGNYLAIWLLFVQWQVAMVFFVMGCMGVIIFVLEKKLMIPAWILVLSIVLWRIFEVPASIPLSLASGELLGKFLDMWDRKNNWWGKVAQGLMVGGILVSAVGCSTENLSYLQGWMESLSRPDRIAMEWVKQNTPKNTRFLIYTGGFYQSWASDAVSEWFPTLTDRTSILTIQGTEWIKDEPLRRYRTLEKWQNDFEIIPRDSYDYLYISSHEIGGNEKDELYLNQIKEMVPVYKGEGVWIFKNSFKAIASTT